MKALRRRSANASKQKFDCTWTIKLLIIFENNFKKMANHNISLKVDSEAPLPKPPLGSANSSL